LLPKEKMLNKHLTMYASYFLINLMKTNDKKTE
ncbi:MAG: hypothetical protein ACI9O3_000749, partial [Colwellia sp.]